MKNKMTDEYKPYLVWRNIVIWSVYYSDTHVRVEWSWQDFSNERFCSGINKDSFMYPDDSSDEMQFLKMLMDRYIVDKFQNGDSFYETQEKEYICDIFKHPYEWCTKLLQE